LELLFFTSVFIVFFAYFGYPLTMYGISLIKNNPVKKSPFSPSVTLIITAHNEEKRIREKLGNTLFIDYPRGKLQILVASDGSTDATNAIVAEYRDKGIELLDVKVRGGKENAQKEAVAVARGDILVFTDIATRLDPLGIAEIVSNFSDPSVGCVSSEDQMISADGATSGEGVYVRYEMWMRRLETRVHTIVQLSGSFFAARKEVCGDFSTKMTSDFRTLLNSVRNGMRGVIDPQAIGYYKDIQDKSREFSRKVRTIIRGLTVFFNNIEFLNFFKYGLFTYQYVCHKLLRWAVPFFLIFAFISNAVLILESPFFKCIFGIQMVFYALAAFGMLSPKSDKFVFVKIPKFFVVVNTSIIVAWFKFLKGERLTMWNPSVR
jgi:cellulose synthase/poly-beta-1,6-N-acetylglucosamine synthase-like glycosyltransferase